MPGVTVELRAGRGAWNAAVEERGGTLFHGYEWCELMERLPGVKFHPCWVRNDGGEHPLPVFSQDGRWSWSLLGYGGPCPGGARLSFARLEEEMRGLQGAPTVRVALPAELGGTGVFDDLEGSPGWRMRVTHLACLPAEADSFFERCSGKVRTGVRHARRHGVDAAPLESGELPGFQDLYERVMARVGSPYVLRPELFEAAFATLSGRILGLGARSGGRLVAVSVFLFDRRTCYHWIHAADERGRELQAGYLLLAAGIREAVARGCRSLDLGSSARGSLARHKETWGGRPVEHLLYLRDEP